MAHSYKTEYVTAYVHSFRCTHCRRRVRVLSFYPESKPHKWYKLGNDRHACSKRCLVILDPERATLELKTTAKLIREVPGRAEKLRKAARNVQLRASIEPRAKRKLLHTRPPSELDAPASEKPS